MPDDLATRCQAYLDAGPPPEMTDYVPGSIAEIVIAHSANSRPLDPELGELAEMVLMETETVSSQSPPTVRAYLDGGAALVREILAHS